MKYPKSVFFSIGFFLFSIAHSQGGALVVEKKGIVEIKDRNTDSWLGIQANDDLSPGSRLRLGKQASAYLWIRPWGRLRIGPGSVARLGDIDAAKSGFTVIQLEAGRLSLDVPRSENGAYYLIGLGNVTAKLTSGRITASAQGEIGEVRQLEGECQMEPGTLNQEGLQKKQAAFSIFTLPSGERAIFKDERVTRRPLTGSGLEDDMDWAFAIPTKSDLTRPRFDPRAPW